MTRIRKEPNRYWSKEDKLKIINEVLLNCKSSYEVAKEYDISSGMLRGWIIKYNQFGANSLENKKKEQDELIMNLEKNSLNKKNNIIYPIEQKEFEIVEILSKEYSVKSLCEVMNISRSGYYKWLKTKDTLNQYEINRRDLEPLIRDIHKRKPSYGYHRINYLIRKETGWVVSDNLVHKVCKILNIKSKAKHYKYKKPGEESIKYENLIGYNWNTSRPFEKVVSDTTSFWFKKKKYDWTFYLDVFNNEIVGSDVRESLHGNGVVNHREAVNNMLNNKIKRGYENLETIVHTDQGAVYSSVSFNNIFDSYNVTRSMSRAGTPTDNPVIESKNGWIKKEMYIDFDINNYNTVQEFINDIVWDNNNYRPSYALQYKNPVEYRTQLGFN